MKCVLGSFVFVCLTTVLAIADSGERIVEAARKRIGVTKIYDPAYVSLSYPNGDVADDRGVCVDVVIRSLREAHSMDLQKLIHEDMKANFAAYPKIWGLSRTDRSIDHRRVPNLRKYFHRRGWEVEVPEDLGSLKPGDLVTCKLPGNLPHIMIVSDQKDGNGFPKVIHNIGSGTLEEDGIGKYAINGIYRVLEEKQK